MEEETVVDSEAGEEEEEVIVVVEVDLEIVVAEVDLEIVEDGVVEEVDLEIVEDGEVDLVAEVVGEVDLATEEEEVEGGVSIGLAKDFNLNCYNCYKSLELVMKYFLRSFSPFRWFKKGTCQFLVKECAQYWWIT